MKKICIFCSSSDNLDKKYSDAAKALVGGLCKKGYAVVSGGSYRGTMGVVADTAKECGGVHIGVMPEYMAGYLYDSLSEVIWTPTMGARKQEMRKDTDALIALPGGIGTLDELIEAQVLIKLKKYSGRLILLNIHGFYEPFRSLLEHYVSENMLTPADKDIVEFFDTPEAILETL